MNHLVTVLGKRRFIIDEPVFSKLKLIIAALNRISQAEQQSTPALLRDVSLILSLLLGDDVKRLRWFNRPSAEELTDLLQKLPAFLGLNSDANPHAEKKSFNDSWNTLYCVIADRTGWTFEMIDSNMTLSRLAAFNEHWLRNPPVNMLAAAYMGYQYEEPDAGLKALIRQLKQASNDHG